MGRKPLQVKATCICVLVLAVLAGCRRQGETATTATPQVMTTKSGIEMVLIPAGTFDMGSDKGTPDEAPVHKVSVGSFWMDRYEVVQEEFRKYQRPDPSHFKGQRQPLEQINWTDAAGYCNDRSRADGLEPCYDEKTWACNFSANGYRLPTEAEWEYACRAGTTHAVQLRRQRRAAAGRTPGTPRIRRRPRIRSGRRSPTPGASTTCTATSPSGATTATRRTTTSRVPTRTPAGRARAASGSFAAGRGTPAPAVAGPPIGRAAFRSTIRAWRMMRSDFAV